MGDLEPDFLAIELPFELSPGVPTRAAFSWPTPRLSDLLCSTIVRRSFDTPNPRYPPATPNNANRHMEEKDEEGRKGEEGERDVPPLLVDPKRYVRYSASLLRHPIYHPQHSRCSQNVFPVHQARRCTSRLLHDVQEGGDRVRHQLRQEVR